jgi:hypothetical protein
MASTESTIIHIPIKKPVVKNDIVFKQSDLKNKFQHLPKCDRTHVRHIAEAVIQCYIDKSMKKISDDLLKDLEYNDNILYKALNLTDESWEVILDDKHDRYYETKRIRWIIAIRLANEYYYDNYLGGYFCNRM